MIIFSKSKINYYVNDDYDCPSEITSIFPLLNEYIVLYNFKFRHFFNFIIKHKDEFNKLYSHLLRNKSLDEFIIEFNKQSTIKYNANIRISFETVDVPVFSEKDILLLYPDFKLNYLIISNDSTKNNILFKYLNPISITLNNIKNLNMFIDNILPINFIKKDNTVLSFNSHTTGITLYKLFYDFFELLGINTNLNEDLKYKWLSSKDTSFIKELDINVELSDILYKNGITLSKDYNDIKE